MTDIDVVKIVVKSQVEAQRVVCFALLVFIGVLVVANASP